jgi:YidC/Oxa1 family membrane protein insertase
VNDFLPPDLFHHFIHAVIPVANIFGDLRDYMRDFLAWIESGVGNWGVAIILLTIIVRIVIFPLTWKQIRSQMAMQSLAPKIKEIQAKHKGDKQRIQQETMRLYQEYRVNPLASCFPLLLQLPVFILLYYCIRNYPPLQDATFLWFTLGQPDPYYILLVIYVVSQLISTELMLTPETQAQQKWMMRAMPLIFVAFLWKFPSGLFVYWITTNLWTIGQVMVVRYLRKHHPVELKAHDGSAPRKRSRFLEAMSAAQQQREGGSGGTPVGGRSRGKPGQRPSGKPGQRPSGKPGQRPSGKPGQRPPGKPGQQPAARSSGDGPRRAPAAPSARPAPGARPGGAPGQASAGSASGKAGQQPAGRRSQRPAGKPGQVQTSRTGKRPVKPKGPRPQSPDGS